MWMRPPTNLGVRRWSAGVRLAAQTQREEELQESAAPTRHIDCWTASLVPEVAPSCQTSHFQNTRRTFPPQTETCAYDNQKGKMQRIHHVLFFILFPDWFCKEGTVSFQSFPAWEAACTRSCKSLHSNNWSDAVDAKGYFCVFVSFLLGRSGAV